MQYANQVVMKRETGTLAIAANVNQQRVLTPVMLLTTDGSFEWVSLHAVVKIWDANGLYHIFGDLHWNNPAWQPWAVSKLHEAERLFEQGKISTVMPVMRGGEQK